MATIVQGTKVAIDFAAFQQDGSVLSMTSSARVLILRFTVPGATSTTFTRSTAIAGQFAWTDQANGTGYFAISAATNVQGTLPRGTYNVEVEFTDSDTSDVKILYSATGWTVVAPGTGTL